jgi:hypothetical protein
MDKVRKSNISVCYTPLSEPYSIYYFTEWYVYIFLLFFNSSPRLAYLPFFSSMTVLASDVRNNLCEQVKMRFNAHRVHILQPTLRF